LEHGVSTLAQGLVTAWSLVAVAFFALGILAYLAIRRTRRVSSEEAAQAFRSLDIEAFRNLVDSAEEAFLRDNLPPKKFRQIQRQRARVALMYAWEAGKAASGVQVAESAFRLRLQSMGACLHLLTEVVFPNLQSRSVPHLVDQYKQTAETLFRLARFSAGERSLVRSKSG